MKRRVRATHWNTSCVRRVTSIAWQLFTVTQTLVTKLRYLCCERRRQKLEIGEEVWHYIARKQSSSPGYYHEGRYRKLWF